MKTKLTSLLSLAAALGLWLAAPSAQAQVGKSLGVVDANTAAETNLAKMAHMTPEIVKDLIAKRPFTNIIELNAFLLTKGLSATNAMDFYKQAFILINLNTATPAEILLVPGAGQRMVREFQEYRPWTSFAQFDREISKYVQQPETDRLKQYVFIPVKLNTATTDDILSIPGAGQRMVREFNEYRPWTTKAQFDREIGKYVDAKEVARLWRYLTIDVAPAQK